MADDLDRAVEYQQRMIDAALTHRAPAPELPRTGACHYCEEPVSEIQLFCDSDCAQDWEREQARV